MATPKNAPKTVKNAKPSKADKFVSLGQKRVGAALHKIRLVRNLANRASYDFDAEQVEKIKLALQAEVDALDERFQAALSAPDAKAEKTESFSF